MSTSTNANSSAEAVLYGQLSPRATPITFESYAKLVKEINSSAAPIRSGWHKLKLSGRMVQGTVDKGKRLIVVDKYLLFPHTEGDHETKRFRVWYASLNEVKPRQAKVKKVIDVDVRSKHSIDHTIEIQTDIGIITINPGYQVSLNNQPVLSLRTQASLYNVG